MKTEHVLSKGTFFFCDVLKIYTKTQLLSKAAWMIQSKEFLLTKQLTLTTIHYFTFMTILVLLCLPRLLLTILY